MKLVFLGEVIKGPMVKDWGVKDARLFGTSRRVKRRRGCRVIIVARPKRNAR